MKTRIDLSRLTDQDLTSLLLFSLYKLHEDPNYSTLSQLAFLLDKESLIKLLKLYGGTTIKVPTIDEFQLLLNALNIYNNVNIEYKDINKVISSFVKDNPSISKDDLLDAYTTICNVLKDYSFSGH